MTRNLPAVSRSRGIQKQHLRRYDNGKVTAVNRGVRKKPELRRRSSVSRAKVRPLSIKPQINLPPKKFEKKDRSEIYYQKYVDANKPHILWVMTGTFDEKGAVKFIHCPVCGKHSRGELMMFENIKSPGLGAPVTSTLCKECWQKHIYKNKGVLVLSIDSNTKKPIPGRLVIIKEEALQGLYGDKKANPLIVPESKTMYMPDNVFDNLFGVHMGLKEPRKKPEKPVEIDELIKDIESTQKKIDDIDAQIAKDLSELKIGDPALKKLTDEFIDAKRKSTSEGNKLMSDLKKLLSLDVEKIGKENLVVDLKLFKNFMDKRFPGNISKRYVEVWAKRFGSSDPTREMDRESLEVYNKLVNNADN